MLKVLLNPNQPEVSDEFVAAVSVKDVAQLIVERATLINHLLPQDEHRTELAEHVLTAMIDMFYMYLIKAQLPQIEAAFQWVCSLPVFCCNLFIRATLQHYDMALCLCF